MQFKAGDFVVHPVYGVGRITTIEKKQFSEMEACLYYQIAFPKSNIWVPIEAQTDIGLRLVTAKGDLYEYRDLIKSRPVLLNGDLPEWHVELASRLKEGSFRTMCEVVRDLTALGWQKPLSTTNKAILKKTQERLYQEWAAAADISMAEATKEIDALLQATQETALNNMTALTREQVLQIIESARMKGEIPKLLGADLAETKLRQTQLGGIDLTQAELHRAKLSGAALARVDLSGVDFHGAGLIGANLNQADLSEADLSEADLFMANLSEANLSSANFSKAKLFKANLTQANLFRADLSQANLSLANFSLANLGQVNLDHANLKGANFNQTDLRGADLRGADLSNADLSSADLRQANLKQTTLKQANLNRANLKAARYNQTTVWPLNFDPIPMGATCED